MKKLFFALSVLLFISQISCFDSSDEDNTNQLQLSDSRNIWLSKKTSEGPDYIYSSKYSSFAGFFSTWTYTIENDKVISRDFIKKDYNNLTNSLEIIEQWTEDEDSPGSHYPSMSIQTIDQLYDQCSNVILKVDMGKNYIYLYFHEDGILKNCTYREKYCVDDCNVGVNIYSYQFQK